MTTQNQVQSLTGATVYDRSGEKIGRIDAVYYDDQTNEPSWIAVHTGLFGTHQTFVPLQGVEVNGDQVTVAFDKARVKGAVIIRLLSVGSCLRALGHTIGQRCALPGRYQLAVSGCAASAAGRFSSVTGPGGTVNGSQSAKPSRRART
jgi:sporulation protein YlmC with PRC-barrel domain